MTRRHLDKDQRGTWGRGYLATLDFGWTSLRSDLASLGCHPSVRPCIRPSVVRAVIGVNIFEVFLAVRTVIGANIFEVFLAVRTVIGANISPPICVGVVRFLM